MLLVHTKVLFCVVWKRYRTVDVTAERAKGMSPKMPNARHFPKYQPPPSSTGNMFLFFPLNITSKVIILSWEQLKYFGSFPNFFLATSKINKKSKFVPWEQIGLVLYQKFWLAPHYRRFFGLLANGRGGDAQKLKNLELCPTTFPTSPAHIF